MMYILSLYYPPLLSTILSQSVFRESEIEEMLCLYCSSFCLSILLFVFTTHKVPLNYGVISVVYIQCSNCGPVYLPQITLFYCY